MPLSDQRLKMEVTCKVQSLNLAKLFTYARFKIFDSLELSCLFMISASFLGGTFTDSPGIHVIFSVYIEFSSELFRVVSSKTDKN